jgi:hypothetical protein
MNGSKFQFKAVMVPLILLFALTVSGCALIGGDGDGGEETTQPGVVFGNQATLQGNATLMCSQSCTDVGFCGTDVNGVSVIILNSSRPATINQDLIIPDQTPVTILDVQRQNARVQISQDPFTIDYYLVNAAERGQGWVAGWCIGQ